jgi:hypothetical protein
MQTKPKEPNRVRTTCRNVVINGTHVRIKSVFDGKIPLEKALGNIAARKIAKKNKNDKF